MEQSRRTREVKEMFFLKCGVEQSCNHSYTHLLSRYFSIFSIFSAKLTNRMANKVQCNSRCTALFLPYLEPTVNSKAKWKWMKMPTRNQLPRENAR